MSPESPEQEADYTLTPRTEAKYNKIDEDFQLMMQRNHRVNMTGTNYTMPVSVPVGGSYSESGMLQASPQMAHTNISPRPSSSETDSGKYMLDIKDQTYPFNRKIHSLSLRSDAGDVQWLSAVCITTGWLA